MEPSVIVAIIASVIAFLSLTFGIYKHFSTRKVARLAYEVSQISDYGVPGSMLQDITSAPISLVLENIGNKSAENIILRLRTRSDISAHTIEPENLNASVDDSEISMTIPSLNPTQKVKVFLRCAGSPSADQIESLELTHSEGSALNKKSPAFTKIKFHFLFTDLEFDLASRSVRLLKIGPWIFRGG